jgi:hypothetical protein
MGVVAVMLVERQAVLLAGLLVFALLLSEKKVFAEFVAVVLLELAPVVEVEFLLALVPYLIGLIVKA